MRPYELVVVFHPDLEIDIDTPIAKIEKLIESTGGKVVKRDNWGKRRLAYKVKHQEFGVYVLFEVLMDGAKVRGLESNLLITDEVMRHLLVRRPEPRPQKEAKIKAKAAAKEAAPLAESEEVSG